MKTPTTATRWLLSTSALIALALGGSRSSAATAFLSTIGPGGSASLSNPIVVLSPGASTTLFLYFTPGAGDAPYIGIGMDVNQSTSGIVTATSFTVANPDILVGAIDINDRWNTPTGGTLANSPTVLISNMVGVAVSGPAGLDSSFDGSGGILDAGYDASAGAFLFGTVTLEAGLTPGTTDLSIAVGPTLIVRSGDTLGAGPPVFFGAGEGASVDGTSLGGTGSIADATITVIPEPGAPLLMVMGGVTLLLRRKRRWLTSGATGPLMMFLTILAFSASPAQAGFKYKAPLFDGYPLGDGTMTPANLAKVAPTKVKLGEWINKQRAAEKPPKPALAGPALTAAAEAKFLAIRANICSMLEVIACQNKNDLGAKVAACGKALFNKGSICIDFGTASQGAQYCDTSPDCEKDKINLNITEVPCTTVFCYDPHFYAGLMTLYEEVRHAQQDWTAPITGDANTDRAKRQLKAACNELDVDVETRAFHASMCAGLDNISNGDPHGQTDPIVKKILDKIVALGAGAAQDAAIAALKPEVEKELKFDVSTSACYQASKDAITEFCNGTKTFAEMNECLGKIRWDIPGQTNKVPPARPAANSGSGSGDLEYSSGIQTEIIPMPLSGIFDTKFGQNPLDTHPDDDFILVSGLDPTSGFGTVFLVLDGNDDGFFFNEAPPLQIVPPNPLLCWTLELIKPCSPGGLWMILDGKTGFIYVILDSNFDGLPDLLDPNPINGLAPVPPWVREVRCGFDPSIPQPHFLQGLETQTGGDSGNYSPEMDIFQIDSLNPNGPFGNQQLLPPGEQVLFPPVPIAPVLLFHPEIHVMAPPGSQVEIFQLDLFTGQPFGPPLGGQIFPPGVDELPIPVAFPPVFGQPLFVGLFDQTLGNFSNPIFVGVPGDMNCDGEINGLDIEPFVLAIINPLDYLSQYGKLAHVFGDINGDGEANALDIMPFVSLLVEVGGAPALEDAVRLEELLPPGLDSDGDGMGDGSELIAGTDLNDPQSVLRVTSILDEDDHFILSWTSVADRRYHIDFSADGLPGSWVTVTPTPVQGTGDVVSTATMVPAPAGPKGLFRVRVETE